MPQRNSDIQADGQRQVNIVPITYASGYRPNVRTPWSKSSPPAVASPKKSSMMGTTDNSGTVMIDAFIRGHRADKNQPFASG